MKHFSLRTRRKRESGAALITALMVSVASAMIISAGLAVAMTSTGLGWNQVNMQAALQLADAGVNSELQNVAINVGQPLALNKSSQPIAAVGVSVTLPGVSTTILGRPGTVSGYSGGKYYVYSSNNAAGTIPWDGVTSPFYITSSACVNGCWQTVQVTSTANSLLNVYGVFATGTTTGSTGIPSNPAVTVSTTPSTSPSNSNSCTTSTSNVTITGSAGINGTVSCGSHSTFKAPTCINANAQNHNGGQFTSSNVSSGGQVCSVQAPLTYPKTTDCVRNAFGVDERASDSTAFTACQQNSSNSTGVYHYNSWANNANINTSNCTRLSGGVGTTLNNNCFAKANIKPGTYTSQGWWWWYQPTTAVQTLIFEPGDYYFSSVQLAYAASCEMIVDSQAFASGGTPGQVRFWLCDANSATNGNNSDSIQMPITCTMASGQSSPDPGMFRIFNGKDGSTCSFTRPANITDWTGNTRNDDFDYYAGVYSCTKQPNDSSSSVGSTVSFNGTCGSSTGSCNLKGSMLVDHLTFSGSCHVNYTPSQCTTKDPHSGGSVTGWSCHGH